MALSVSCCMGTEVSFPDTDRSGKAGRRSRYSGNLRVCGLRVDRIECAARSRAPGGDGATEGIGVASVGPIKGSDIDEIVSPVSIFEKETILGQSFLGQGLLCGHRRVGCGYDAQVCPLPGAKGASVGAAANLRLEPITAAQLTGPAPSGGRALSPLWRDFFKVAP
jgi:hypothetical protein